MLIIACLLPFYGNEWLSVRWHPMLILWLHLFFLFVILPPLLLFLMRHWKDLKKSIFFKIILLGLLLNLLTGLFLAFFSTEFHYQTVFQWVELHLMSFLIGCFVPILFFQHRQLLEQQFWGYLLVFIFLMLFGFRLEWLNQNLNLIFILASMVYLFYRISEYKKTTITRYYWQFMLFCTSLSATLFIMGTIDPYFNFSPPFNLIQGFLLFFGVLQTWSFTLILDNYKKPPSLMIVFHCLFILCLIMSVVYHPLGFYITALVLILSQLNLIQIMRNQINLIQPR